MKKLIGVIVSLLFVCVVAWADDPPAPCFWEIESDFGSVTPLDDGSGGYEVMYQYDQVCYDSGGRGTVACTPYSVVFYVLDTTYPPAQTQVGYWCFDYGGESCGWFVDDFQEIMYLYPVEDVGSEPEGTCILQAGHTYQFWFEIYDGSCLDASEGIADLLAERFEFFP